MKIISQKEIDEAAWNHAREYVDFNDGDYLEDGDLLDYSQFDFKAGVKFAESYIEDICIEFLDSIRNYERENGQGICFDERNSREFSRDI